jgi:RNA polymerase sigma-70 factor (ECF subfamily)
LIYSYLERGRKMDIEYNTALKKAKYIALRYVGDENVAEEISQLTSIQLFLNEKVIDKSKIDSWLFTVTRNLCMDYFRDTKKKSKLMGMISDNNFAPSGDVQVLENETQKIDLNEYDFISKKDRNIMEKYYHENYNLTKLAKSFKIKKEILKKRIYRIEKEISLYHKIHSDVLYINPIPATRLTKNIRSFTNTLTKCIHKKDFSLMKRYLKDSVVTSDLTDFDIVRFANSKIKFMDNSKFLLIIAFYNSNEEVNFIAITFMITESRNIQVLEIPIIPTRVVRFTEKACDPKEAEKKLLNSKGYYNGSLGKFSDLAKKGYAVEIPPASKKK